MHLSFLECRLLLFLRLHNNFWLPRPFPVSWPHAWIMLFARPYPAGCLIWVLTEILFRIFRGMTLLLLRHWKPWKACIMFLWQHFLLTAWCCSYLAPNRNACPFPLRCCNSHTLQKWFLPFCIVHLSQAFFFQVAHSLHCMKKRKVYHPAPQEEGFWR